MPVPAAMMRVLLCIGEEHDPWLVALALLVVLIGSTSTVALYSRIAAADGRSRAGWVALTSVALGGMIWSTHFVAMLAFRTPAPVVLDAPLTLLSLVVAVLVAALGLVVATSRPRWAAPVGGGIIGGAIAAMHYVGMASYRIDGVVRWDGAYVAASVVGAITLSALALEVLRRPGRQARRLSGALLLGGAVVVLHFTGMAAMTIVPLPLHEGDGLSPETMTVLASATAFAGLLLTGCAATSALIDNHNQSETYRRMRHMTLHDDLTGLPNRVNFNQAFETALAAINSQRPGLAVVMMDLARFKEVNDSFGHQAGDRLLVSVAERLGRLLRPGEAIARLGGDEFAALKPFRGRREVDEFLGRITQALSQPFVFERFTARVQARIGVALAPLDGRDPDLLIANADLAMHRAKTTHSRTPSFYEPAMDEAARHRRELGNDLRAAIGTPQFSIAYQPQVCLHTGQLSGFEALARWNRPEGGPVSPAVFVPLAEEIGEITRLGDWVLSAACAAAAAWQEPVCVAVNVSPLQLSDVDFVEKVRAALDDSGLPAELLEIELTESAIMQDRHDALTKLRQIKRMGVKIALDDFGTGYSSLEVLRSFPFDRLKLDRSFVAEVEESGQAVSILRSVAALGRTLGIPVLAEGIETPAQLAIVRREGCDDVQGYLIGRPGPVPVSAPAPLLPLRPADSGLGRAA